MKHLVLYRKQDCCHTKIVHLDQHILLQNNLTVGRKSSNNFLIESFPNFSLSPGSVSPKRMSDSEPKRHRFELHFMSSISQTCVTRSTLAHRKMRPKL